jgi:hypothetical protein
MVLPELVRFERDGRGLSHGTRNGQGAPHCAPPERRGSMRLKGLKRVCLTAQRAIVLCDRTEVPG